MIKKVWTMLMVIIMTVSLNMTAFATDFETDNDSTILQQAIEIDAKITAQNYKNFNIISLTNQKSALLAEMNATNEKVLQAIEYEDDLVKVTTIFPYKVLNDGELINSFEYTPVQLRSADPVPSEFVDVTVTVTAYFAHYFSMDNVANFYRHAGIEAYWSSNNSTVSVSNMLVRFDSAGQLYKYPECMTQSLSSTLVDNYYFIRSTIERNNPVKAQVYLDGNHTMPINRVLLCTDYFNHGGLVYLKLTYVANGKNYQHDRSYYVYSK